MPHESPRTRLIRAAERVLAEQGLDAPLREVAAAAGQRNNSAVQYHFGSRDGLVEAVLRHRLEPMERRRAELLADLTVDQPNPSAAGLVDVMVRPMFTTPYADGATHYARFLEQARLHPLFSAHGRPTESGAPLWPTTQLVMTALGRTLRADFGIPRTPRARRLELLPGILFRMAAEVERRAAPLPPSGEDITETVAMVAGMLCAPYAGADLSPAHL